jgi:hypothetical protein
MRTRLVVLLAVMPLLLAVASAQSPGTAKTAPPAVATKPSPCSSCGAATPAHPGPLATQARTIPGTNETIAVGQIENVIPIGVLTVLGCEKCSAEAVTWALQQGSSFDEVERALRTVAAMQKLDCFKAQFGADVNARMAKPLAAAWEALAQARTRAAR